MYTWENQALGTFREAKIYMKTAFNKKSRLESQLRHL
ncbi:hypothetical protein BSG1_19839 [Bacillus sp. SG-1]|nr:hypothetical protein BSG1_19839 [Bacillus sp. SG-1]